MKDYLIRATAFGGKVRAFAALTTELVSELHRRHRTMPTATAALGRTATAAAMMGAMLKGREKLTIQVRGGGPLGQIVVDANADGDIRGYVDNPDTDLPLNAKGKLDVGGAVGNDGFLYVTKDLGLKEPYRGSSPVVSGELGEDFTLYFTQSEQTPSAVALGVLVDVDLSVKTAGGFIIQLMPGLSDEEIGRMERKLGELPQITRLLEEGKSLEAILGEVLEDVRILEQSEIRFACKCSRDRVEQTLISLGTEELAAMIEEDGKAEVVCHFCNEAYMFDEEDLKSVMEKIKA